tara:strand:- start:142 stop:252 length:111 start_codon:yes stop_codon:yes gene_type:complete
MNQKQNKNWHCNNCKAELLTDKDIEDIERVNNDKRI